MKPLPENYKEAYCEACLNKQAKGIKVAGGVAAGVLGTIVSVGIALLKNGKKS